MCGIVGGVSFSCEVVLFFSCEVVRKKHKLSLSIVVAHPQILLLDSPVKYFRATTGDDSPNVTLITDYVRHPNG